MENPRFCEHQFTLSESGVQIFAQVTFRLPDTLFTRVCTVKVKAHGHVSNSAIMQEGKRLSRCAS
jgi:hypothetical protein